MPTIPLYNGRSDLNFHIHHSEMLREYLARFMEESHKVKDFDDKDAITVINEGAKTSDFLKSIVGKVPRDMAELMARVKTYMGIEDYLEGQKGGDRSNRRQDERSGDLLELRNKRNKNSQPLPAVPPQVATTPCRRL